MEWIESIISIILLKVFFDISSGIKFFCITKSLILFSKGIKILKKSSYIKKPFCPLSNLLKNKYNSLDDNSLPNKVKTLLNELIVILLI